MGTYYVGRVLKLGVLNQQLLVDAIKSPAAIEIRGSSWTFSDVEDYKYDEKQFLFGRLIKYHPKGEVSVIDTESRSKITQIEPNLVIAESPFVYIPEHSGIVFLNVYNHIEQTVFTSRFCKVIERTHKDFFVDCKIEMVSDLRTFAVKLLSLEGIYLIKAKVSPPNPLFGPLWASLKEYLEMRNTDRLTISEDSPKAEPLKTDLPTHVQKSAEQDKENPYKPESPLPIGDAAILMAADGYGSGFIKGKKDNEIVTIKTSETVKNFSYDRAPKPIELFKKAWDIFENIKNNRHMKH